MYAKIPLQLETLFLGQNCLGLVYGGVRGSGGSKGVKTPLLARDRCAIGMHGMKWTKRAQLPFGTCVIWNGMDRSASRRISIGDRSYDIPGILEMSMLFEAIGRTYAIIEGILVHHRRFHSFWGNRGFRSN